MLTLQQMEEYYRLLQTVETYQAQISSRTSISAVAYDGVPGGHSYTPDRIGKLVASAENAREVLHRLREEAAARKPEVERTITAAMKGMSGRSAVRIETALMLHYISGYNWYNIGTMLHTGAAQIRDKALQRLKRVGGYENDPGSTFNTM